MTLHQNLRSSLSYRCVRQSSCDDHRALCEHLNRASYIGVLGRPGVDGRPRSSAPCDHRRTVVVQYIDYRVVLPFHTALTRGEAHSPVSGGIETRFRFAD